MSTMLEKMRAIRNKQSAVAAVTGIPGEFPMLTRNQTTTEEALQKFGYKSLRPGQKEIIDEVLGGKDGVLAVMATGYGKSALFQIPALMTKHLTVVVSPLISLMKDQVDSLLQKGVRATCINSTQTQKQQQDIINEMLAGQYDLIYVSPERFGDNNFVGILRGMRIGLFAIDEAHCISSWGHDFRPSYSRLGEVIKLITPEQVLAVTATATDKVKDDIIEVLGIPNAKAFVRGIFRDNLEVCIFDDTGMHRPQTIAETIIEQGRDSTGIVYVATKKEADALGVYLRGKGVKATAYHAGLKDSLRKEVQENWAENGGVVVATSAFGMGIDRADVRFVIHSGFTGSIEEWYQAIGRAGRDGKPSIALSLYNIKDDYGIQTFLIDLTTPDSSEIKKFWRWMRNHAMINARPNATTTTINMTQSEMGNMSKCNSVGAAISLLKQNDLVQTIGRGKYQVALGKKEIDFDKLDEGRKRNLKKFGDLVRFFQSRICRYATICSYFGDDSFHGKCGNCDNCNG